MSYELHFVEKTIGGRKLRIETGKLGRQAAGTVLVQYGETVVLVAVVTGAPREGTDFFPLTVDYREKTYAAGKFPGGFFKREARPTQKEILTMRMIDRPVRPLFPKEFKDEVLIQAMVLAATSSSVEYSISSVVGLIMSFFSTYPIRQDASGPSKGREEIDKAAEAPTIATMSGSF